PIHILRLSLHDALPIFDGFGEQADLAREAVHRFHLLLGDRRVVERRVAADKLGDEAGFHRREELLADLGGALGIFLQDLLRSLEDRESTRLKSSYQINS